MWRRYVGAGLMFQALMLGGCEGQEAATVAAERPIGNANEPVAQVPVAVPERLVLAFGDSLYAGYGLNAGESLPDRLQAELRAAGVNATVVNAGVSGDTTAAGRQRFAFALDSLARAPDLILLGLGGNDVLRQIAPAETRANMVAMLDEAKRRGVPVVLTGMQAPPNLGLDYARKFNTIWPDLAKQYDATLDPFILDGVVTNGQLMLPDRVHPNARGVTVIADRLSPILTTKLKAQPAG